MTSEDTYTSEFCSRRLKAIADPTRWAVITQLIDGPKNVGELNSKMHVESTLLSHHLRILRDEGFIEYLRVGKTKRYQLSPEFELTPSGRGINLGCCSLELNFPLSKPQHSGGRNGCC